MPRRLAYRYGPVVTDEAHEGYKELLCRCFAAEPEKVERWMKITRHENMRILESRAGVVAGLMSSGMNQYFGGREVTMAGISGVGVLPERRGGGAAATLMQRHLEELHENGVALSTLYASTQSLYRRVGYEPAGVHFHVKLATNGIGIRSKQHEVCRLSRDDQREIEASYARFAAQRNGYLVRNHYNWEKVFDHYGTPTQGYGLRRDGRLEAYVFHVHQADPDSFAQKLRCKDVLASNADAARSLLSFLADYRSMCQTVEFFTGASDPMLLQLPERASEMSLVEHWMTRIVDVKTALEARGYAKALELELHLELEDELLPGNRGRFVLEVAAGRGTVRKGGRGRLKLGIHGLAPLYTGLLPPVLLEQAGLLTGTEREMELAATIFAGGEPSLRDFF